MNSYEFFFQPGAGVVETGVDGAFGEAEGGGNFGDGQFVDVAHEDREPVFFVEGVYGSPEAAMGIVLDRGVFGGRRVGEEGLKVGEERLQTLAGFAFTEAAPTLVDGDGGEPGFETGVPAESGKGTTGGEEGVLGGVVGLGLGVFRGEGGVVVEDGEGEPLDVGGIFPDQRFD